MANTDLITRTLRSLSVIRTASAVMVISTVCLLTTALVPGGSSAGAQQHDVIPMGETHGDASRNGPGSYDSDGGEHTPVLVVEYGVLKAQDGYLGPCEAGTDNACSMISTGSTITYDLVVENEGSTALTNYRLIDVFPFAGGGTSAALTGDGRTPASTPSSPVLLESVSGEAVFLYSADPAGSISLDPQVSEVSNTWCDSELGGTAVYGTAADCPTSLADVTAIYANLGDIAAGTSRVVELSLLADGADCTDLYTNTFGSRTDSSLRPTRSNTMTVKVEFCDAAIDVEKFTNGNQADNISASIIPVGSAVTWQYEVTNVGDTGLAFISVVDSDPTVVIVCPSTEGAQVAYLAPGATELCEASGIAISGQYSNAASVEGFPVVPDFSVCGCGPGYVDSWPSDLSTYVGLVESLGTASDSDMSHYTGYQADPSVAVAKVPTSEGGVTTSGTNKDAVNAAMWAYEVTNDGNVAVASATLNGSDPTTVITCAPSIADSGGDNVIDTLLPGEVVECEVHGVTTEGSYDGVTTIEGSALYPDVNCACDPTDPGTWPVDVADYLELLSPEGVPVEIDGSVDLTLVGHGAAVTAVIDGGIDANAGSSADGTSIGGAHDVDTGLVATTTTTTAPTAARATSTTSVLRVRTSATPLLVIALVFLSVGTTLRLLLRRARR